MACYDNKEETLVSVIIPVYNVSGYLREALDSVITQTYRNLEIIIVDDGSTDGSGKICDDYSAQDSRIIVIHQSNRGLSAARNAGLDSSTGQVISFLDSDDAFHPQMIRIMMDHMYKYHADITMCEFDCFETDGFMIQAEQGINPEETAGKVAVQSKTSGRKRILQKILRWEVETAPWNKLYRREIWENLRFPEGYVYEGTYLVFDIFDRARRVVNIDRALIRHRIRQGSICTTNTLTNTMDMEHALNHFYSFVNEHVPGCFTFRQAEWLRVRRIRRKIRVYIEYSGQNPGDTDGLRTVRMMLKNARKDVNLNLCAFPVKLFYWCVYLFPQSLWRILYPIYQLIRHEQNNG